MSVHKPCEQAAREYAAMAGPPVLDRNSKERMTGRITVVVHDVHTGSNAESIQDHLASNPGTHWHNTFHEARSRISSN
jgi:hypothetical protein